jgi:hypothetical protein
MNLLSQSVLFAAMMVIGATHAFAAQGGVTRQVAAFEAIDVSGATDLMVTIAKTQSVRLIAPQAELADIITEVKDKTLHIHRDKQEKSFRLEDLFNWRDKTFRCEVTVPALRSLDASGASKVDVRGLQGVQFALDISGASTASLQGTVQRFVLDVSGASSIDAEKLVATHAELDLSGATKVVVNASKTLKVDASGASRVRYIGNPMLEKDLSGACSVSAK